ncbi:MAG: YggS family pyridoxal phosphate-dependent enzyme [Burkholderiaceae bacterium]
MTTIEANLQAQRQRLADACQATGRDVTAVTLLAVSKTFDADAVARAVAAGQRAFGENYIQEGWTRCWPCAPATLMRPCNGIASARCRATRRGLVAEHFDWVQSVDRLKIAQRLSEQRPPHLPPLQVCLQVNVDGGPNKSGVAPDALPALAAAVAALPRLQLRGLMCIPEPAPDFEGQRALFLRCKVLFDALREQFGSGIDTLSMGMSDDLEAAVAAGATLVRVGRGVFGERPRKGGA